MERHADGRGEIKGSGDVSCGYLPRAVPCNGVGDDAPRLPEGRERRLDGEVGYMIQPRLADPRGVLVRRQLLEQRPPGERLE